MKNTSVSPQPKKRGPVKRGYVHGQILLPPDDLEWGKSQHEGFSAYVRRLIREDRQRREAVSA